MVLDIHLSCQTFYELTTVFVSFEIIVTIVVKTRIRIVEC